MSRKRKPVLQLGASSSKLHKYGYSKEFHSADKKGKSSLQTLVGNYSDSDGEDSPTEQEDHSATAAATDPVPDLAEASAHQPQQVGNGDMATGEQEKSPDMDDELKNFLSEIEAIPMPTEDAAGDQDKKSNSAEPNFPTSLASKEAAVEPSADNGDDELPEDPVAQDVSSSSVKAKPQKPQYSMFVKGASEFVHSPSSQDAETSSSKGGEVEKRPEDDIPKEPTSCWQLVQDEGSQYYYYWNTLTNEVTWEIPSEYTQFLLLHREFTEKLARLPPAVLKAYQERKAKEAEALASASAQSSAAASHDPHTQQTAHGPVDRSSPTPASVSAELTSSSLSSHRAQRKHRKEKKKRRHKRRHSDSSSDSSDGEGSKEGSKTTIYGPQLPQGKQPSASGSVTKSSDGVSSTIKSTAGSQLLSIVPYLSDADEDENDDEEKGNATPVPDPKKTFFKSPVNSSDVQDALKNSSYAGAVNKIEDANLDKDVPKLKDSTEEAKEKAQPAEEEVEPCVKLDGGDTSAGSSKVAARVEKPAKEVIDMFAEDTPQTLSPAANHEPVTGDDKAEKETDVGKDNHIDKSSHTISKDHTSTLAKTSASSFNSSPSVGLKTSREGKRTKGKDKNDVANLLNIVGYGSDEEEQASAEDKDRKERQPETKKKEDTVPLSKQLSSPSSSESRKRKKEKKKHKHDEKDKKEKGEERRGVSPPNILTGNLGRDIKARVEETLDKEISDIVIQTVSQTSLSELTGKISSSSPQPDQDMELKSEDGKMVKHSQSEKEAEKSRRTKGDKENAKKATKVTKHVKEEKLAASEEEKGSVKKPESSVQPEKEVNKDKDGEDDDDDDDDDIDFEDLDDLDRALEVALEKKKVELAKYEEQERKQEKHSSQVEESEEQPSVTENTQLSSDKVEAPGELEEKLKAEVKDTAELALSKLEFLDISTDNLSRLQILFIELQTRLHDWTAGGLSTVYFQEQLGVAQGLLEQYEQSAVPQGWACQWDRGNNRYYYRNLVTNRIQWDYPDADPGKPSVEKSGSGGGGSNSKNVENAGKKSKEEVEKKTSGSKREKSHDERGNGGGGGSGEDKDGLRKKGGSSSRHRKREERDKDRGSSKHDKRREGSSSGSHRYRRKRRRRRDHSSSSDSSEDDGGGGDTNNVAAGKSSSVTSSSSRRHHRHHHKVSKKKKKQRRSEQRSRSPSVEIVAASDDREGSGKENGNDEKSSPAVTVVEASPVSTPLHLDRDTEAAAAAATGTTTAAESIDGEPLGKNGKVDNKVGRGEEDGDVDGVSLDLEEGKGQEDGEIMEEEGEDIGDEEEEKKKKAEEEATNPAVIYKPPQIVVPAQLVAAARQPELYGASQSAQAVQAPPSTSVGSSGQVPAQDATDGKGLSETAEEAEKQARKKKKEKKLATGPSLMMKKKHMSSMVQKWQKVKKEVEKEDRAKEMRQAAIRKKIEELK